MAATSLAIWKSPLVTGCHSSSSSFGRHTGRQFSRAAPPQRRFPCLSFSSGALLSSFDKKRRHIQQWRGQRTRIAGQSNRAGGSRLQIFCVITDKTVFKDSALAIAEPSVRRLILLRHAKSSWADRSIKVIRDIITAAPTSKSRISRIWSNMEKSWASDHERPLSKRGRQAAANLALKLNECQGWNPQLILCSDSTRTRETLNIMQQKLPEFLEGEVRYFSSFYSVAATDGQTVQHLEDIICKHSKEDVTAIMCMGHNRGWEEAASILSGTRVELKTANAALLEAQGNSWQEAFERAGLGGWKLVSVVRPDCIVEGAVQ